MRSILTGNSEEVTDGFYTLNNNNWNIGDRVNGVDFTQTISYDPADMTRDVQMDWAYDNDPDNIILSYPQIGFGYRPWVKKGPDFMISKLSDLRELEVKTNIDIGGQTGAFNVAYDLWLTDTPGGGPKNISTEVMVWLHTGYFPPSGEQVATFEGDSFTADVYMVEINPGTEYAWTYIAFAIEGDRLDSTIDLDAMLRFLVRKGYVNENEYLSGVELGPEIQRGTGSMDLNSLDYSYGRYAITTGADSLMGTDGDDNINGQSGSDSIAGAAGADRLIGGVGNDRLAGEAGNDSLDGGEGADTLTGGAGNDRLTGGAGADLFVWNLVSRGDVVTDFRPDRGDRIDLRNLDANLMVTGNQAFDFVGTAAFSGARGELRAEITADETRITADINGDKLADVLITFDDAVTLQANDFLL